MANKSIIFLCLLLFFSVAAAGQDIERQQKKRDALERDIAILRSQLGDANQKAEQALSYLSVIQAQKESRQKLLRESDREIRGYNARINEIKKEIARQQATLDTLQTHYSNLVLGAYKNRDVRIWYMYILASDNVSQAFRRFGYFKSLASQISTQARKIELFQAELSQKQTSLIQVKNEAQAVRARRAEEVRSLKENEQEQKKLIDKLKKDKKAYQKAINAKRKEMKEIDEQISKMLRAATSGPSKKQDVPPVDMALAKSFEKNKGRLPWPATGPVTEHFGHYKNKELNLSLFNNGINIACSASSPVYTVFDGVVSNIMIAPGFGQCILIQHGNYYTTYCKVKNASVKQGDHVKTGQQIGQVATILGKTQLHFRIWKKSYLDPEIWLRKK